MFIFTKINFISYSFWRYCKDLANLLFSPQWHKLIASTCRKIFYLHAKNQLHISCLSWDIAMKLESCCFGYFKHAWLWPSKTMVSALRKLWCLSSYKKTNLSLTSSLRRYCKRTITITWGMPGQPFQNNSVYL